MAEGQALQIAARSAKTPAERSEPRWLTGKFTLRRATGLAALWFAVAALVPFFIAVGAVMGVITGMGKGMADGAREAYRTLQRCWILLGKD
jgi:hypothetical protein